MMGERAPVKVFRFRRDKRGGGLLSRAIPAWLVAVLLVSSVASTAVALTIYSLTVEKINLWGGQYQDTANVTVQLLNSTGDVLVEQTASTGDVSAGGTWSYTFRFHQTNLVANVNEPFVVIKQTG